MRTRPAAGFGVHALVEQAPVGTLLLNVGDASPNGGTEASPVCLRRFPTTAINPIQESLIERSTK